VNRNCSLTNNAALPASTIAALYRSRWQVELIDRRLAVRMVTRKELVAAIENVIAKRSSADEAQRRYVQSIETMMEFADGNMLNGHWGRPPRRG
jgi:IS4 transposase